MIALKDLLEEIRGCERCELPMGPNPVVRADSDAKLLIIGQAPGIRVHRSGIPWDDPSGDRLRNWLQMDKSLFYDESRIAIVPMAFCYPGTGKSGDLPPPPVCSETWHESLLAQLPKIEMTLLIGSYAQNHYLGRSRETLTDRVKRWQEFAPTQWPLPHPSPRNQLWLKKNAWFEEDVVPAMRESLAKLKL